MLISVIVPIYNVEDYLPRCLDSIIAQTYQNLQIILINDGSTDRCPQICDEYAARDERIVVVHKENGGLSSARNAGLEIVIGDYVGFIDGDDWIDQDMLESLFVCIKLSDSDIAFCGFQTEPKIGKKFNPKLDNNLPLDYSITDIDNQIIPAIIGEITFNEFQYRPNSVCDKLYASRILQDLRFQSERIIYLEDALFNLSAFCNAHMVSCRINFAYHYFTRNNSLITSRDSEIPLRRILLAEEFWKTLLKYNKNNHLRRLAIMELLAIRDYIPYMNKANGNAKLEKLLFVYNLTCKIFWFLPIMQKIRCIAFVLPVIVVRIFSMNLRTRIKGWD